MRLSSLLHPLVEALAALLSQPATFHHTLEEVRDCKDLPAFILRSIVIEIACHMQQSVEARKVGGAEDGGPGATERRAENSIDLIDGVVLIDHTAHNR